MNSLIGLDSRKIGALFYLRAKLAYRQFTHEPGRIISAVLTIFTVLPSIVGIAVATWYGYTLLAHRQAAEILGFTLFGIWFIWLIFPVLFSALNRGADITRLLVYPITRRDWIISVFLGSILDYPSYLMLPLFVAIIGGWGTAQTMPFIALALLICYGHMVVVGQLLLTIMGSIWRSRFHNVVLMAILLLGIGLVVFILFAYDRAVGWRSLINYEVLFSLQPLTILQWFPTGAIARAIERASLGAWMAALAWLCYAGLWLGGITWVWWQLLIRLTTGQGFLLSVPQLIKKAIPPQKQKRDYGQGRGIWGALGWLPLQLQLFIIKDIKTGWRTPQRRAIIVMGFIFPFLSIVIIVLSSVLGGRIDHFRMPAWISLSLPFYGLFLVYTLGQNIIAWEGRGLSTLLLTPIHRQHILLAKGLSVLMMGGFSYLVLGGSIVFFSLSWFSVLAVLNGLCVMVAAVPIAIISSVLYPFPIDPEEETIQGGFSTQIRGGCGSVFMNVVVMPIGISMFSLPIAIPLGVAFWQNNLWIAWLGFFVGAMYATALFWFGIQAAGRLFVQREPEIWQVLSLATNANSKVGARN